MRLYLVTQTLMKGYDTYDSMVVAAESVSDARTIHPYYGDAFDLYVKEGKWWVKRKDFGDYEFKRGGWPEPKDKASLLVKFLGLTEEPRGVILASFNAG